jgi:hypothetical protein
MRGGHAVNEIVSHRGGDDERLISPLRMGVWLSSAVEQDLFAYIGVQLGLMLAVVGQRCMDLGEIDP